MTKVTKKKTTKKSAASPKAPSKTTSKAPGKLAAKTTAKTPAKVTTTKKAASVKANAPKAAPAESAPKIKNPSLDRAYTCTRLALEKKLENLRVLDVSKISSIADFFVIASASNERQLQAAADSIVTELKKAGARYIAMDGYTEGRWIVVDYGDVIIHLFLDAIREYYHLEGLWEEAERVQIPAEFYGTSAAVGAQGITTNP